MDLFIARGHRRTRCSTKSKNDVFPKEQSSHRRPWIAFSCNHITRTHSRDVCRPESRRLPILGGFRRYRDRRHSLRDGTPDYLRDSSSATLKRWLSCRPENDFEAFNQIVVAVSDDSFVLGRPHGFCHPSRNWDGARTYTLGLFLRFAKIWSASRLTTGHPRPTSGPTSLIPANIIRVIDAYFLNNGLPR